MNAKRLAVTVGIMVWGCCTVIIGETPDQGDKTLEDGHIKAVISYQYGGAFNSLKWKPGPSSYSVETIATDEQGLLCQVDFARITDKTEIGNDDDVSENREDWEKNKTKTCDPNIYDKWNPTQGGVDYQCNGPHNLDWSEHTAFADETPPYHEIHGDPTSPVRYTSQFEYFLPLPIKNPPIPVQAQVWMDAKISLWNGHTSTTAGALKCEARYFLSTPDSSKNECNATGEEWVFFGAPYMQTSYYYDPTHTEDRYGMNILPGCPNPNGTNLCICDSGSSQYESECTKDQGWRNHMDPKSINFNSQVYGYWAPYTMISGNGVFVLIYNANEDEHAQVRRVISVPGRPGDLFPYGFGNVASCKTIFKDGAGRGAGLSTEHWTPWTTSYIIMGGDKQNVMERLSEITGGEYPLSAGLISGTAGVSNATVTLASGTRSYNAKTEADGSYKLGGLSFGQYTLSVCKTGYTFSPASIPVAVDGSNHAGNNFTGSYAVLPGDCDNNHQVSIGEVQKAINMFLGLEGPGCGSDVNGDGQVSIGEVQKVINAFLGISTCSTFARASLLNASPSITLGNASGAPGSTVTVPVTLSSNGAGVCAASFKVPFDSSRLSLSGVTNGPAATAGGKSVSYNLDATTSTVTLGVIGNNQNMMNDGIIAYLNFTVLPNAGGEVALGGYCGAADADGNDLPSMCSGGTVLTGYSVSGAVTYATYPLGNVKLTLKQGDTVVSTVYSESDGSFSFRGIANGSYTIYPSKSCTYFCSPTSSCDPLKTVTVNGANISGFSISAVSQAATCCISTFRRQVFECGFCDLPDFQNAVINVRACLQSASGADGSPIFNAVLLASTAFRAEGQPKLQEFQFEVDKGGDYYINVINGDPEVKETLVSSATVDIAPLGEFFGPSDFSKQADLLVKPVHLDPGFYSIVTEVRSQPGAYMTVVVCDKDFSMLPELP